MEDFTYYPEGFFFGNEQKPEMEQRLFYLVLGLFFAILWVIAIHPGDSFSVNLEGGDSKNLGILIMAIISPWLSVAFLSFKLEDAIWFQKIFPYFGYFISTMFFGLLGWYFPALWQIYYNAFVIVCIFSLVGIIYPRAFEFWKATIVVSVIAFLASAICLPTSPDMIYALFVFHWITTFILAFLIGGVYYQAYKIPRNFKNAMLATGYFFPWIVASIAYLLSQLFHGLFLALKPGTKIE